MSSAETQEIFAGNPEETEEKTKDKGYAADYIEEIEERQMETVEQMPARNKDAVLPAPSVMELLSKAEAAGESPEIIKDEENDITLLDYSDLL